MVRFARLSGWGVARFEAACVLLTAPALRIMWDHNWRKNREKSIRFCAGIVNCPPDAFGIETRECSGKCRTLDKGRLWEQPQGQHSLCSILSLRLHNNECKMTDKVLTASPFRGAPKLWFEMTLQQSPFSFLKAFSLSLVICTTRKKEPISLQWIISTGSEKLNEIPLFLTSGARCCEENHSCCNPIFIVLSVDSPLQSPIVGLNLPSRVIRAPGIPLFLSQARGQLPDARRRTRSLGCTVESFTVLRQPSHRAWDPLPTSPPLSRALSSLSCTMWASLDVRAECARVRVMWRFVCVGYGCALLQRHGQLDGWMDRRTARRSVPPLTALELLQPNTARAAFNSFTLVFKSHSCVLSNKTLTFVTPFANFTHNLLAKVNTTAAKKGHLIKHQQVILIFKPNLNTKWILMRLA